MKATLRTLATAALCGLLTASTASAQKSTDPATGVSRGGGGGGGGGSKVTTPPPVAPPTVLNVKLLGSYYGLGVTATTTGQATITYDATGTSRSLTVTISNVNLPDGTIMHFEMVDNAVTIPTAYYPIWGSQPAGNVLLVGGTATLSIDTANGDAVPLVGTIGSVNVHALNNSGADLGTILSGSYNLTVVARKGGRP